MTTKRSIILSLIMCAALASITWAQDATATPAGEAAGSGPSRVDVTHSGLFPEGVEWDSANGRFLVSSVAEGTVYAVNETGQTTALVTDERIPSSIGIEADEANNRLLVAATDLKSMALLGIYDLTSGENLAWVDFGPLLPGDREHFANDVAADAQGNAYVTDSLAGVIYRVDPAGNPSVFLEHESFSTDFALNGIVYHESGDYLLAVRVPGLIKIPIGNPAGFTEVEMPTEIPGADGIVLLTDNTLAVVSNKLGRVYRIESGDDWATAQATAMFETGPVNPTTVAVRDGEAYVLYAYLNSDEDLIETFPIVRVEWGEERE
jgi:hypothetical protein